MAGKAKEKIEKLRREINRHNYLYYVENNPEISDRQYDRLYKELEKLEKERPELVTGDPTGTPVSRLDESRAAKELDVAWGKS